MSDVVERTFEGGLFKAWGAAMVGSALLMVLGCAGSMPPGPTADSPSEAAGDALGTAVVPNSADASSGNEGSESATATDSGLTDGGFTDGGFVDGGFGDGGFGDSGGSSFDPGPTNPEPNASPSVKACPPQAFGPETEGCTMTQRTPADCATISYSEEFAWEADACHTPYYIQVTGNPPDENNYNEIYIDAYINALSWAEPFSMEFIDGLYSADGWYHWRVCNAYISGCSATRAFRME
ncbi:MAG: hypothetical protein ACE5E5_12170 [Phycisphaerae bacterium]